ncbi:MAG: hypothetical protein KC501_16965 [Myxococcales bacterium]|nr:hypothetical protein [Myxococcales bacterium]
MRIDRARLYDKRVVQRNIRAERVTKEEYKAWLAELPDVSDKIRPRDEGGDDDGFEGKKVIAAAVAPAAEPPAAELAPAVSPAQMPSGEAG